MKLMPVTRRDDLTVDTYLDFAGKEQRFTKPPRENAHAETLRLEVVAPAIQLFNELDNARAAARSRGLLGFEMHEAAGQVRPRVRRELIAMQEKLEARLKRIDEEEADALKCRPEDSPEARLRYTVIVESLPDSSSTSRLSRERFGHRISNLTLDEACAVLTTDPRFVDPAFVRRAAELWKEHNKADDPERFEAFRQERDAIKWASGSIRGLVYLTNAPSLAKGGA